VLDAVRVPDVSVVLTVCIVQIARFVTCAIIAIIARILIVASNVELVMNVQIVHFVGFARSATLVPFARAFAKVGGVRNVQPVRILTIRRISPIVTIIRPGWPIMIVGVHRAYSNCRCPPTSTRSTIPLFHFPLDKR
jgi:hypothetical protein